MILQKKIDIEITDDSLSSSASSFVVLDGWFSFSTLLQRRASSLLLLLLLSRLLFYLIYFDISYSYLVFAWAVEHEKGKVIDPFIFGKKEKSSHQMLLKIIMMDHIFSSLTFRVY